QREKIKWEMTQGVLHIIKKIFPFIIYITFTKNWITYKSKRIFTDLRMRLTYGLSHIGPQLLESLKENGPLILQKIKKPISAFTSLKSSEKMSIFGFLIFTIASISAMIWVLKADLLKEKADPFLLSMEEWSSEKYVYDSKENMESFYSSSRVSENVLSFPKIIANIKASRSSESNPMIATEMFFEGFSPEVMLELKDREAEVKDVIINMASTMDYDTLTTIEGKQAMLEKLQQKVNAILTQGQIRKIYLKNFIIKP
nr:flagellar basal body-associated FliL family protein [Pseudobdellovibrionaceae bacterium]